MIKNAFLSYIFPFKTVKEAIEDRTKQL